MFAFLFSFIFNFFRPTFDWLLSIIYGKRPLQRICDSQTGGQRISAVAQSLSRSQSKEIQKYTTAADVDVDEAVTTILKEEGVSAGDQPDYAQHLRQSLVSICGVSNLLAELDKLRSAYDKSNPQHEEYLMELWNLLQPDTPLPSRITKEWGSIGFQGDDPATDFRGMGLLGLLNLRYFAQKYNDHARRALSCSNHPTMGYSFAVVGINMTSLALDLLRAGPLREHFYATLTEDQQPSVDDFHEVYCYVFYHFNQFWQDKKPENVMVFSRIREEFRQVLRERLSSQDTAALCLSSN